MNGKWFNTKASAALIDSGATDLLLPAGKIYIIHLNLSIADDYAIFMNEFHTDLPKGVEMHISKTGAYYYTNCSDPKIFSDLDLQIDDHLYKIPAPLFIRCLEDICLNRIKMKPEKFWVLGISFLQMHY